jgi:hypothetical protein
MEWLLNLLKDAGLPLGKNILRVSAVFITGLSMVYILGRMFDIVKSYRGRNIIAFIVMIAMSFITSYLYFKNGNIIYESLIVLFISVILYVLIGFKLYDRIDSFLDKNVGEDKPERKKK